MASSAPLPAAPPARFALARVSRARRALLRRRAGLTPRPRVLARVRADASGQQPFWDNAPDEPPNHRGFAPVPGFGEFYSPPQDEASMGTGSKLYVEPTERATWPRPGEPTRGVTRHARPAESER